ncbi:MAG: AMP-binding protein, partial [Caulobacteraceae bacterium]
MLRGFDPAACRTSLFDALVEAARTHGAGKPVLEDQERKPLSYTDIIRAAFALGRKLSRLTERGEHVGVLLPTSAGAVVTFFALHAIGRVPVMLNFTAGLRNLRAAAKLAGVKRVLSSHRFVEQGKLHDVIDALEQSCQITYLEDVRASIGLQDRLYALAASLVPR